MLACIQCPHHLQTDSGTGHMFSSMAMAIPYKAPHFAMPAARRAGVPVLVAESLRIPRISGYTAYQPSITQPEESQCESQSAQFDNMENWLSAENHEKDILEY